MISTADEMTPHHGLMSAGTNSRSAILKPIRVASTPNAGKPWPHASMPQVSRAGR